MGPSTTVSGVGVGLGASEAVAVCVAVGMMTAEVGGKVEGVCVALEKGEEVLVSKGVARAVPAVDEETA